MVLWNGAIGTKWRNTKEWKHTNKQTKTKKKRANISFHNIKKHPIIKNSEQYSLRPHVSAIVSCNIECVSRSKLPYHIVVTCSPQFQIVFPIACWIWFNLGSHLTVVKLSIRSAQAITSFWTLRSFKFILTILTTNRLSSIFTSKKRPIARHGPNAVGYKKKKKEYLWRGFLCFWPAYYRTNNWHNYLNRYKQFYCHAMAIKM